MNWHDGFNNQYRREMRYVVVKRGDVYVAVLDVRNDIYNGYLHEPYQDLMSQGFIYWNTIFAENSKIAIEQAKELEEQEINKLRERIRLLERESKSSTDISNLDPYEVLGFSRDAMPSKDQVKERKRKLSKVCHPDLGGSSFLMKLINGACSKLGV
ncbi:MULTISPECIES: J domain-containing protein [Enterobacter cloacae complex]|jgi:hypothetical protein|uniref:J domain-containing protein n=1 Tax=Enterobacter cloacae complex TaxID=354276 RepID=UPI00079BBAD9|nr:J domain-containing protein [Enterobacter ludwigii]EMD2765848.1 hypothetical protein [Enterobacter asburiae]CZY10956.1 Uncharacterised protein [Enterobacter ludwigii]SAG97595.1 Uncharacterised protein [Enterobacter ludwigii]